MVKLSPDNELAVKPEPEVLPKNHVKVRVLPKGDGKVSTGEYDQQTNSFPYHKRGDTLVLHESIARTQEDNGYVEIL